VRGYELGLAGQHQLWNAALAVAALKAAGFRFKDPVLREGLKTVHWPARFQRLDKEERLILDGAHNVDSADNLARTWWQKYPGEKASIVFGAAASKDIRAILRALQPIAARWHFTDFESPRSAPPEQLKEVQASLYGQAVETFVHSKPSAALVAAKKSKERVLITGSLYLAGEVLAHVRGEEKLFQATSRSVVPQVARKKRASSPVLARCSSALLSFVSSSPLPFMPSPTSSSSSAMTWAMAM